MKTATFDSVDKLPPACIELMKEAGERCFFSSPDWFKNLECHGLAQGQHPRYYVVSDTSDTPLAILPMQYSTGSFLKPRTLKSLTSFYTMDFAPILKEPQRADLLEGLARAVLADKPAFDVIDIRMFTEGESIFDNLKTAFANAGARTDSFFQFDNWVHKVSGQTAEEYYNERPSRLKNTIRRKRKKFEEAHKLSFLLVTGDENLEKAIADYHTIYAKSWKEDENFPDFIPALLRLCARAGVLRLGVIYADDKPVAAQFWMIYGKTAMIYKLAYDEDYAALSAGSILSKHMMDHAIDVDHVEFLDYGVGNDSYKRDWMTVNRKKVGILAYNKTIKGLLAGAHHFLGALIKQIMKPAKTASFADEAESTSD